MTCPKCEAALQDPMTGQHTTGCRSCDARRIAKGPAFHASVQQQRRTDSYQQVLHDVFGADAAAQDEGNRLVWDWHKRIEDHRKGQQR